jgi:hypothetical protein
MSAFPELFVPAVLSALPQRYNKKALTGKGKGFPSSG